MAGWVTVRADESRCRGESTPTPNPNPNPNPSPSPDPNQVPRRVVGLQGIVVTSVACGGACSAAVTADGELFTWGSSTWQQVKVRVRIRARVGINVRVGLVQLTLALALTVTLTSAVTRRAWSSWSRGGSRRWPPCRCA